MKNYSEITEQSELDHIPCYVYIIEVEDLNKEDIVCSDKKTYGVFHKKIVYDDINLKDPFEQKIMSNEDDDLHLQQAILSQQHDMPSVTKQILFENYLMSCLLKRNQNKFIDGFKIGLVLCENCNQKKKFRKAQEQIKKEFQKQLKNGQLGPINKFLEKKSQISTMLKFKNFYEEYLNKKLIIKEQQKFQKWCSYLMKSINYLINESQNKEERAQNLLRLYLHFHMYDKFLETLQQLIDKNPTNIQKFSSQRVKKYVNQILENCNKFMQPKKFSQVKSYQAFLKFKQKNKKIKGKFNQMENTKQRLFFYQLFLVYKSQVNNIKQKVKQFLQFGKEYIDKNRPQLENLEYQHQFNLFQQDCQLQNFRKLIRLIFVNQETLQSSIKQISALEHAAHDQLIRVIKYWLIQLAKQIATLQTIVWSQNIHQRTKFWIKRAKYNSMMKFKTINEQIHYIFATALLYRSIYEYQLMIKHLDQNIPLESLKQRPVEKEYFYYLHAIGHHELNNPEQCLKFLTNCKNTLNQINLDYLSKKSKKLLLSKYTNNDYLNYMERSQKIQEICLVKQQDKIKLILKYEKEKRSSELSLLMAFQCFRLKEKNNFASVAQRSGNALKQIKELDNFTQIYQRYNYQDSQINCLKFQYYLDSKNMDRYFDETNKLSDKFRKKLKNDKKRFQDFYNQSKTKKMNQFDQISDDLKRLVFEGKVQNEELKKYCRRIEIWSQKFQRDTLWGLVGIFQKYYFKKNYQAHINSSSIDSWEKIGQRGKWTLSLDKSHGQKRVHVYHINFNQDRKLFDKYHQNIKMLSKLEGRDLIQILHYEVKQQKDLKIFVFISNPTEVQKIEKFLSVKKILSSVICSLNDIYKGMGKIKKIQSPERAIKIINREYAKINPMQCQFDFEEINKQNDSSLDQNKFLTELKSHILKQNQKRAKTVIPEYILPTCFGYFQDYLKSQSISFIKKPIDALQHHIFWSKYKVVKMMDQFCQIVDLQRDKKTFQNRQFRFSLNQFAYEQEVLLTNHFSKITYDGDWRKLLEKPEIQNLYKRLKIQKQKQSYNGRKGFDPDQYFEEIEKPNKKKPEKVNYFYLYDRYLKNVRNQIHHYIEMEGAGHKAYNFIQLIIKKQMITPRLIDIMFCKWKEMERRKKQLYAMVEP